MALDDVSTADLLAELQRRVECADKKERRTIFIGEFVQPRERPPAQRGR